MDEKKYDQKFVFGWKDGALEFTYEQDGKYAKGKMKNNFDFGDRQVEMDKVPELEADAEWAKDPVPQVLEEKPSLEALFDVVPEENVKSHLEASARADNTPEDVMWEDVQTSMEETIPVITVDYSPEWAKDVHSVVLDAHDPTRETVQVDLPLTIPQIVAADVTVVEHVDPLSPDPQVKIAISDASAKIPDDTHLVVVKTEAGQADMIVAVPDGEPLNDVKDAVTKAVELVGGPALPDLSVTDPDHPVSVLPQVVQMRLVDGTVTLHNVSEDVPEGASLHPVETPSEMPNIVVAIDAVDAKKFDDLGVDPVKEFTEYLMTGDLEIATNHDVDEKLVFETFGHPCDDDTCSKSRWRRWKK